MTRASILLATVLVPTALWAQAPPAPPEDPALVQQRQDVERLFEAGRFQEVIAVAAAPDIQPAVVYMAAQSYLKSSATPTPQQLQQAAQTFQRLEAQPAGDPWHFIGMSGRQLVQNQPDESLVVGGLRRQIAQQPPSRGKARFPEAGHGKDRIVGGFRRMADHGTVDDEADEDRLVALRLADRKDGASVPPVEKRGQAVAFGQETLVDDGERPVVAR